MIVAILAKIVNWLVSAKSVLIFKVNKSGISKLKKIFVLDNIVLYNFLMNNISYGM